MTATTDAHNTPSRAADQFSFPLAAQKALAGTIAVINSSGYAEMGTTATGKKCVGVFEDTVDNASGAAGDKNAPVRRGCYRFGNSASGDLIARTDIGATCYIVDNQTVAKTDNSGARSAAGVIRDVDANGVWVEF